MELDYLMEKKLQLLVEMNTKKLLSEFAEVKSQLSTVQRDLETLRANVKNIRVEQAQAPVPIQQAQHVHQSEPVVQQAQRQVEPASANETISMRMARTGNYTPQDVNVEKFFYFGNKK